MNFFGMGVGPGIDAAIRQVTGGTGGATTLGGIGSGVGGTTTGGTAPAPDFGKLVISDNLHKNYESILKSEPGKMVLGDGTTIKMEAPRSESLYRSDSIFKSESSTSTLWRTEERTSFTSLREAQKRAEEAREHEIQTRRQVEAENYRTQLLDRSRSLAERWRSVVSTGSRADAEALQREAGELMSELSGLGEDSFTAENLQFLRKMSAASQTLVKVIEQEQQQARENPSQRPTQTREVSFESMALMTNREAEEARKQPAEPPRTQEAEKKPPASPQAQPDRHGETRPREFLERGYTPHTPVVEPELRPKKLEPRSEAERRGDGSDVPRAPKVRAEDAARKHLDARESRTSEKPEPSPTPKSGQPPDPQGRPGKLSEAGRKAPEPPAGSRPSEVGSGLRPAELGGRPSRSQEAGGSTSPGVRGSADPIRSAAGGRQDEEAARRRTASEGPARGPGEQQRPSESPARPPEASSHA
ncbi:MAG: hypothetical protein AB1758_32960, partial [Candidatus Eremiobacterota bacterium]